MYTVIHNSNNDFFSTCIRIPFHDFTESNKTAHVFLFKLVVLVANHKKKFMLTTGVLINLIKAVVGC